MNATASALSVRRGERLYVELADSEAAVREAQRLRYEVFGLEMGARLKSAHLGIDVDDYDSHCQHLLVRQISDGQVVGCTRLLDETGAGRLGGWYSSNEFELGPVAALPGKMIELGRTCVSPKSRSGAVIAVLWSGLASFIHLQRVDYLFGCASMPLGEQDLQAAAIMNRLRRQSMSPEPLRVVPKQILHESPVARHVLDAPLPPLLKAYVRLGARACGEPCRDPDFQVADVLMLLDVNELDPSYARHFFNRHI